MYLLVSCGLWVFRSVFELAHQIKYINIQDVLDDPPWDNYMDILVVLFHTWPTFIAIALMFALGVKSTNGVWSNEHELMSYNPDGSQDVPLGPLGDCPPRYSPRASSSMPTTHDQTSTSLEEGWQPSPVSTVAQPVPTNQPSPIIPNTTERVAVPAAHPSPTQREPSRDEHDVNTARMSDGYNTGGLALISDGFGSGMPNNSYAGEAVAESSSAPAPAPAVMGDEVMDDALIADGYRPSSPPAHDEAMGFNHQADGRQPSAPLPYPEKN